MPTDHQLMLTVRNGNIEKLGLLFEEYHKKLYNYFQRQTANYHESEDLVQEVFFRILKYRHTYRNDGNFSVWMFEIARNARNDYYKRRSNKVKQIDDPDQLISSVLSPDKVLEQKSDFELLQKALDALSQEKKELILMSRYHDLSYKEISTILRCTVGTVKVRMYRAMKELTDKYFKLTGETRHGL